MLTQINKTKAALENQGLGSLLAEGAKRVAASNADQAPISANLLPNAQNKIIIKDELLETVGLIKATIDMQRQNGTIYELPFLMMGYEAESGNPNSAVIIDKIIVDDESFIKRVNEKTEQSASFEGRLNKEFNDYAKNSEHKKPVVFMGHTHPSSEKQNIPNSTSRCFSAYDLEGYIEIAETVKAYNKQSGKDLQVGGMVINEAGDFNAVFVDTENKNALYKFPEIYVGKNKLPAYTVGKYLFDKVPAQTLITPIVSPARRQTQQQDLTQ